MHMGIFIDAEKEGYMEEIENLIKAMHQDQIGTIRNSIRQLVIDFLVKKIRWKETQTNNLFFCIN